MINCHCLLINIDTFAASTDKLLLHERTEALSSSWLSKFLLIKFKLHSYGRRYYKDNSSLLKFWLILSGKVILNGMFRTFLKVPVFSCCCTVDSCHKTLMSGVKRKVGFKVD